MKPLLPLACCLLLAACSDRDIAAAAPPPADRGEDRGSADGAMPAPGAFCAAGEDVVFGCDLGQQGAVALCASAGLSRDSGWLQYRETGSHGDRGLIWPEPDAVPSNTFRAGTLMYSGGGGAFLRFERGGQTYTAYTGIGHGWDKAGVLVEEAGSIIRSLECRGEATSQIGPALFERAAIPEDPSGFEIP